MAVVLVCVYFRKHITFKDKATQTEDEDDMTISTPSTPSMSISSDFEIDDCYLK